MAQELTQEDIDRINAKNAAGIAQEAMQYRRETGKTIPGFNPEENAMLQKKYYSNPRNVYSESSSKTGDFWDNLVSNVKGLYSKSVSPVSIQTPTPMSTPISREIQYATPQEKSATNAIMNTSDKGAFESWEAYKKRKGMQ